MLRKKLLGLLRSSFLLILMTAIFFGCGKADSVNDLKDQKRPEGLPVEAAWVGGSDGGVYVLVTKSQNEEGIYLAKVYYENGELWYSGRMALIPKSKKAFNSIDEKVLTGWDGETLFLTQGRMLKAIDPIPD